MSTIFISYSSKDRVTADLLYEKLIEMGYEKPFRDDHPDSGIPAGSMWERELYRKLQLSKALIVLLSRNWLESKWCFAELAYAKAEGKEFFPVLIDDSPDVPTVVAERQAIRLSDPDVWSRLKRGLVEANLAPENDFPWPIDGADACPYPGLASFEACQAGVYFGRDDEILELRERLNQMTTKGEPRLLYVVGASGSGKSSLVKAGLLPRLTRKESSRWCVLPIIRWNEVRARGADWPEELALDLISLWPAEGVAKPNWQTLRERYRADPLSKEHSPNATDLAAYKSAIAAAADRFVNDTKDMLVARNQPNAAPLLLIDQFEEILSAEDDHTVTPFLDFLGCVVSSERSPWRSIATVRSDFLIAIQTRADLIGWKDHTDVYSLSLLNADRFYDVIRRPAEKVGITFHPDTLVDHIVKETGTSDALPLLAFTLRELYERCGSDHKFTLDEYNTQVGGLEGCLTRVANELLSEPVEATGTSKDELERKLHLVFSNYLVRINDKNQYVRSTAVWSELPVEVRPLLQRFIDRRLITSRLRDESDQHSEQVIEVAHDALFRRWDKLARWLDDRRDLLRWRRDIERDRAAEGAKWAGLTRSQLALARDWPAQRREELRPDELSLIRDGIFWERVSLVTVASVVVLIGTLAIVALFLKRKADVALVDAEQNERVAKKQKAQAEANFRIAESRRLAALSDGVRLQDPDVAMLLALEASVEDTFEARVCLQRTLGDRPAVSQILHIPEGAVTSVAFDAQGRIAAAYRVSDRGAGGVVVLDARGRRMRRAPLEVKEGEVSSVAFDSRGGLAAGFLARGGGGGVVLFDSQGERVRPTPLEVKEGRVSSVAFDAQGRIAAGYSDGVAGGVVLYHARGDRARRAPLEVKEGEVSSVAFDSNGRVAAGYRRVVGDKRIGGVALFDAQGERVQPAPLEVQEGPVQSVAFDIHGCLAAGYSVDEGYHDGGVVLFYARGRRIRPERLKVVQGYLTSVAFDKNGRIAVGYQDRGGGGGGVLFDSQVRPTLLEVKEGRVSSVAFDAQGRIAAGYSVDRRNLGGVMLFGSLDETGRPAPLEVEEGWVSSVAFDIDGRLAAGYDHGYNPHVMDGPDSGVLLFGALGERVRPTPLEVKEGWVSSVAFDSNGRVAAGYRRVVGDKRIGGVVVFDAQGERVQPAPLEVQEGPVQSVAFDIEGRLAAAYRYRVSDSDAGGVVLFDARGGRIRPEPLKVAQGYVTSVAFDKNGRIAAGYEARVGGGGGVVLFDSQGERVRPTLLEVKEGRVRSVAFDAQGRIAAGYARFDDGVAKGGGVVLFDAQGERVRPAPLEVKEGGVRSVAFGSRGGLAAAYETFGPGPILGIGDVLEGVGGGVVLFDAEGQRVYPAPLEIQEGFVRGVAFDAHGRLAAGYSVGLSSQLRRTHRTGGVVFFDGNPTSLRRKLERVANRNFTWEEWTQYFPASPYRRTIRSRPWPVDLPLAERIRAERDEKSPMEGQDAS